MTKRKTTRKAKAPRAVATTPGEVLAPEAKPLDDLETMFVEQYFLSHMNQTEAAVQAYNPATRPTARAMGSEVMRRPHVRAAVKARLQQVHLDADEVLARYSFIIRGSMEDFLDIDSQTVDLRKGKEAEALDLIKKFKARFVTDEDKRTETLEVEIEMHDKLTALRDVARALHLFGDEAPVQHHEHLHLYVNGKPLSQQRTLTSGAMDAEIVDE